MNPLNLFKNELEEKNYTCTIGTDEKIIFTSKDKGVKPLLDFYKLGEYKEHKNIYVADKIIGRGASFFLVAMSIKALYTPIISESAKALLDKYNIKVVYNKVVPYIINREGTGLCPIESSVLDEENVEIALQKIQKRLIELQMNNG